MKQKRAGVIAGVLAAGLCSATTALGQSVLTFHGSEDRSGHYIVPELTWARARRLHLDERFHASVPGHVYAQPLYWHAPGSGRPMLLVATEDDVAAAIDANTGSEIWKRAVGNPVPRSSLPCGDISPLGITGTPAISESTQAVYFDAAVESPSGPRHLLHALSLKDGSPLPGWPIDVASVVRPEHGDFIARDHNQRGALTILGDWVYVAFGGNYGDCGRYHGTVVGVSLADPQNVRSFVTRAPGAGIWAPGGASSDGKSLFVATGNGLNTRGWEQSEAVLRLPPDLHWSDDKRNYFAPADWRALDDRDADLGGTNPMLLDVPSPTGSESRVLALGKDAKAYLLDRDNLGGIGGNLEADAVAARQIIAAPAAYPAADGILVAFQGPGTRCPGQERGRDLTVLKIRSAPRPLITTAWCGAAQGAGSPIVTTTDGTSEPIVWMLGAQGDDRLHGFRGDTGDELVTGPPIAGLRRFQTLIATRDRIYVAADGHVYAFAF